MRPTVSICLITYNHEPFIAQSLESALAQETNFPFEIVVGEDCSTDRTREIVRNFRDRYPQTIRVLPQECNLGLHRNYARCLRHCRGEYIAVLEGDDYWTSPKKLCTQVRIMERDRSCALCGHRAVFVDKHGVQSARVMPSRRVVAGMYELKDILYENFIVNCSVLFRRDAVECLPEWWYSARPHDWCLHVFNAQSGSIVLLDDVMVAYRAHPASITKSTPRAVRRSHRFETMDLIDRHLNFRYHRVINRAKAVMYFAEARQCELEGDIEKARRALRQALARAGPQEMLTPNNCKTIVRLNLPFACRLYRATKACLGWRG